MSLSNASTSPRKAYVIGAGLAGLACAVKLAAAGVQVQLSDAAAQAGGRCRSYFDPQLGMTIDNGNHLVLSGNRAVHDYLALIGASDRLAGPDHAVFSFVDLKDGRRWTIRPNEGPLPWWVLDPARRTPGTTVGEHLAIARLLRRNPGRTVGEVIAPHGSLWERLIQPFLLAALNIDPAQGSADLAGEVIRQTLARGGRAYRPRIASPTLAAAFVDPARTFITEHGGEIRLGRRLRDLGFAGEAVTSLAFADGEQAVGDGEAVILALPPGQAHDLIPGLVTPTASTAIVNAHFGISAPAGAEPMIGVVGGLVEWIFAFPDRVSVTISGADRLLEADRADLASRIWAEVAQVHSLPPDLPPWQVVKEKRATFAATPEQDARRPWAKTRWSNLHLAGDWTQTGLPATIEGAIQSGFTAAEFAVGRSR